MLLLMEVGMLVMGLCALVTGRLTLTKQRVVHGAAARWLGVVALLPVPLAIGVDIIVAVILLSGGQDPTAESFKWLFIGIEAGAVVLCLIVIYTVGGAVVGPPRRLSRSRELEAEAFRGYYPERFGGTPVPGDAIQGTVPLRTMALAGYYTPPPVEAAPPELKKEKPALRGWALVGALAVVGATSATVALMTAQQNSPAAAGKAEGEPAPGDAERVEPTRVQPRAGEVPPRSLPENEQADWPGQVPARVQDALLEPGARVFLSDLQEFAWKPGAGGWTFGKAGRLGALAQPKGTLRYLRETPAKGLSMHPPHRGYTRVCYYLGRRAQSLRAKVFLSEDDKRTRPKPTRFVILGDGQLLWRSPSMREFGSASWFTLNVSQVDVLELRTYVETGNSTGSHAGWFDPYVVVKK